MGRSRLSVNTRLSASIRVSYMRSAAQRFQGFGNATLFIQPPKSNLTSAMTSRVTQQSIRSSCDRCRLQKLRCTVPTNAEKCERCARAKVDCVFSRRARTRRTSDEHTPGERIRGYENLMGTHPMNAGAISPLVLDSVPDCRANEFATAEPHMRYGEAWEGNPYGGHSAYITVHEHPQHGGLYAHNFSREYLVNQGQHDSELLNFMVPPTPLDGQAPQPLGHFTQQWKSPSTSQVPSRNGRDGEADPSPTALGGTSHAIPRLSVLIAEVYETCGMLKDSHWANMNSLTGMNDYPIGRILHLSQEFIDILQRMAQSTSTRSGPELGSATVPNRLGAQSSRTYATPHGLVSPVSTGSGIGHPADISEARLQDQAASETRSSHPFVEDGFIDVPAMLLVLSCFISLTKLYGIVFTHFESHLSGLPPASLSGTPIDIGLIRSRGLQLGELPLLDETYSKTYTGVRMLLDTFQCTEDIIGLPSSLSIIRGSALQRTEGDMPMPRNELKDVSPWTAFQGELTLAVLKHDALAGGSSVQEGFYDLSLKIQSLKRILREKMFL